MPLKASKDFFQNIHQFIEQSISNIGVESYAVSTIKFFILISLFLVAVLVAHNLVKNILVRFVRKFASHTPTSFDDFLLVNKLPVYIARLAPLMIAYSFVPLLFENYQEAIPSAILILDIYSILIGVFIARAFLKTIRDYLKTKDSFKDKPIDSYVQVLVIALYFIAGLLVFTTVTGKSVVTFFTTLGAASAILLLIFKDTILGFVASIQVTANDMVRIGDWITMEKYGADGDVIEITLTAVKVQNFDKTITTIPTYSLISDSFKNWRGMRNAGGRRIKRSIRIKIATIKYLSDQEIERLKKIQLIKPYLESKAKEIAEANEKNGADRSMIINGRNLTNVGVFRIYIDEYLKSNPFLHPEMTMMVRQLEPQNDGMPLEIYTFTNDTLWRNYERIMADIFDHILAAVPYFDLEVFESPSSADFKSFLNGISSSPQLN